MTGEELAWFFEPGSSGPARPICVSEVELRSAEAEHGVSTYAGRCARSRPASPSRSRCPWCCRRRRERPARFRRGSTGPRADFRSTCCRAPLAAAGRSLVRPVSPTRPARDAALDRASSSASRVSWPLLPSAAPSERLEDLRALLEAGAARAMPSRSALDSELEELPADRAVWVLGRENRFAARLFGRRGRRGSSLRRGGRSRCGEERGPLGRALGRLSSGATRPTWRRRRLAGRRTRARPSPAWDASCRTTASTPIWPSREPSRANVIKGQWAAAGSPLRVDLRPEAAPGRAACRRLPAERAGAAGRLAAGLLREGPGRARALPRLARAGGPRSGQRGAASPPPNTSPAGSRRPACGPAAMTVAGCSASPSSRAPTATRSRRSTWSAYLPGGREDWKGQSVVLGAHYDHLGRGWPDVHSGDEGAIHPGADDNASGVAVLLELAANLASSEASSRNLVFVAFIGGGGGPAGLRSSYVERSRPLPSRGDPGDDQPGHRGPVGRRRVDRDRHRDRPGVAAHLPRLQLRHRRGEQATSPEPLDASDQESFIEQGIPAVQLFTRAHRDYHRPGDTAEGVDVAGLVQGGDLRQGGDWSTSSGGRNRSAGSPRGRRRAARRGAPERSRAARSASAVVPEFGFAGPGVETGRRRARLACAASRPAGRRRAAGRGRQGDRGPAGLLGLLKRSEPGQAVEATVRRGEETLTVPVTVADASRMLHGRRRLA